MKKFSPPQMKEVSFPTPHTLHPFSTTAVNVFITDTSARVL
ncbi:DNA gyrase subunit A [Microcystis panniformis FACHB-1757]|uniref:DNA gyrase subunit A n=1 Tax=Microcystis panniformis FACHB-1757 TaxID=1638788 RepID=A0A0K1S533_9CHRO|nr:DNA gyrase subunit A [Microcystis panniformis FACHB-1757]